MLAHRLSCSVACGIFSDQEIKPTSQLWQVDSYPLAHQAIPRVAYFISTSFSSHSPTPILPLPTLPTGNHWFVLAICESAFVIFTSVLYVLDSVECVLNSESQASLRPGGLEMAL